MTAAAQAAPMPLRPAMDGQQVTPWARLLCDPSGKLTIDQVQQPPYAGRFQPFAQGRTHLGVGNGAWWLRLEVKNTTPEKRLWLLQPTHPQFDWAEMYFFPQGGSPTSLRLGDHAPFEARPIPFQTAVFPIRLDSGQSGRVYIRLAYLKTGIADLRLRVWSPKQFGGHADLRTAVAVLMLGGFITIALFNAFIAFSTRAPEYVWYVAYVLSVAITSLAYQGLGHRFLWQGFTGFTDIMPVVMPGIGLILACQFTRSFLKLRQTMPRVDKALLIFMALALVALGLAFWGYRRTAILLTMGSTVVGLSFPLLGLKLWLAGRREARFYTIAWTVWLAATSLMLMRYLGEIRLIALTDGLTPALYLVEAVLLSMALADRINVLREQKEAAEQKYLDALEKDKAELEQQVRDRTAEIQRMHRQAVQAARTDVLTGLPNRRAFYEDGARELRRAGRYSRPVSLILLDIDRFKTVNDTHGHFAGDEVLKHLAGVLSLEKRSHDLVGRIGGEEFALILPEASEEEALRLAERIRQKVATTPAVHKGIAIPISASFGVTRQQERDSIESILSRADKALYLAKEAGRNRVEVMRPGQTPEAPAGGGKGDEPL